MFTRFTIPFHQRAVVLRSGRAEAALGPGRHWAFGDVEIIRVDTTQLVMDIAPELREVIPNAWFEEFTIGPFERGVLYRDGVPAEFVGPGVHRRWAFDESVELRRFDTRVPLPAPTNELMRLIPSAEITFQIVAEYERGVLFVAGRFERELEPGMHVFWTTADAPVSVCKFDLRTQTVSVPGQDLMTRDKVTLRLTLTLEYRVTELRRAVMSRKSVSDALYLALQLAARGFVAAHKLDELLESRGAFAAHLESELAPGAEAIGAELERVGIKDIILPGDMKLLMNRVIEAEKEAAAKVVMRREEVAAMKSLATSAKVLEESPGALRLKELEALKDMASQVGELRLVVGASGQLERLFEG